MDPGPDRPGGIVVRDARRTFGGVVAVDRLDLTAPPGAVTALVGPNGSGKTTLLLVLATLLVPDSGEVRVAGFDPVSEPAEVRRRTGWMPDSFGTWDSLTCREALTTVADAYRVPRKVSAARIPDLLDLVHLSDLGDRPTQVLSRGQKQRLGLARALVHSPSVLLLDEPASGLDPRSRIELRGVVRRLAAEGAAVLISSHVLAELDEMADRAVVVAGGRTVAVRELDGPEPVQDRRWLLRGLDRERLLAGLRALGRTVPEVPDAELPKGSVPVLVAGDEDAAELLAALVRDGVPVVSCQPAAGVLEEAYLSVTQERR